jgi:hypothetical protein
MTETQAKKQAAGGPGKSSRAGHKDPGKTNAPGQKQTPHDKGPGKVRTPEATKRERPSG